MTLARLSCYDDQGRITQQMMVPDSMIDLQTDNVVYGEADPATEYALDRTLVPRPACPASLDGLTLSGVPLPSLLTINGAAYEVTSDTVTLAFAKPGVYALRLSCWPYLDGNFEVSV